MDTYGNTKTKDISQYLHLYLGCEVAVNGKIQSLTAYLLTELENGHWQDTVKPILRSLSSMTDEEEKVVSDFYYTNEREIAPYLAKRYFEVTRYLLSKHFDLFGLIEAGIALDATTLKNG